MAASLGIADRLVDGPVPVEAIAAEVGAHAPSLYRLMRMLVGTGVLREEADGRFVLTPLGATLRSEGEGSVRDWALYVGAPPIWQALARMADAVKAGEPAFVLAHGMPVYEYMAEHPTLGGGYSIAG